ncbi:MAG: CPBP family intramembrane glutamic endopeptidase [Verrucomicrobiota bacterium]
MDGAELLLGLAGLGLLWWFTLRPAARGQGAPSRLAFWEVSSVYIALIIWGVFATGVIAQLTAEQLAVTLGWKEDAYFVFVAPAMPVGMVLACAAFHWRARERGGPALFGADFFRAGLAAFLLALPLVAAVASGWEDILTLAGLPGELQDTVEMFLRMKSPVMQLALGFYAIMLAPFAEEWVFRGVLFRYARGRLPRWGALVLPAAVWAALHGLTAFAPLLALGVVLELAYERTGNLAVPMLAHALFNLNTVVVLLLHPPA